MKIVIATAVLALTLTACGSGGEPDVEEIPYGGLTYLEVDRTDGTKVECVVYRGDRNGGLDCNFGKRD